MKCWIYITGNMDQSASSGTIIFVTGFPMHCESQQLQSEFEKCGEVIAFNIVSHYAFVHMRTSEQAQLAIRHLHNKKIMGLKLTVQLGTTPHYIDGKNSSQTKPQRNSTPLRSCSLQEGNGFAPPKGSSFQPSSSPLLLPSSAQTFENDNTLYDQIAMAMLHVSMGATEEDSYEKTSSQTRFNQPNSIQPENHFTNSQSSMWSQRALPSGTEATSTWTPFHNWPNYTPKGNLFPVSESAILFPKPPTEAVSSQTSFQNGSISNYGEHGSAVSKSATWSPWFPSIPFQNLTKFTTQDNYFPVSELAISSPRPQLRAITAPTSFQNRSNSVSQGNYFTVSNTEMTFPRLPRGAASTWTPFHDSPITGVKYQSYQGDQHARLPPRNLHQESHLQSSLRTYQGFCSANISEAGVKFSASNIKSHRDTEVQNNVDKPNKNQNKKLFIANLPKTCTNRQLKTLFENYGTVTESTVISNYGFVHMEHSHEAELALEQLNGHIFMGSQLKVQHSTSAFHLVPQPSERDLSHS